MTGLTVWTSWATLAELVSLEQVDVGEVSEARIQVIGYTPDEFAAMLAKAHLTALEAVDHGILLVGGAWFAQQRERLAAIEAGRMAAHAARLVSGDGQ